MSYRQQFMENRRVPRHPVGIEGTVNVPLRPPISCLITNVSPLGGMIALDRYEHIPNRFKLSIDGFETECTVRHRDRNFVGVEFSRIFEQAYTYVDASAAVAA